MSGDTIAVGAIGVGSHGQRLCEDFANVDGAAIRAVADVNPDARTRVGEEHDIPSDARYEDAARMLRDESLDAVSIVTPHTLHYEQILDALDHGCHVLCEKPLVTRVDHARDLCDRDAATDRVLIVGYQRHLEPPFLYGRERWANGTEEPAFFSAEITQHVFGRDIGWPTNVELSAGGQLYYTGTHIVDVLLWMTGLEPTAVTAQLDLHEDTPRLDKHAAITLRFENGAVGTIAISGDTHQTREHHHVWDDDGAVYVDGRGWRTRELTLIEPDGTERSIPPEEMVQTKPAAFIAAIRTDSDPPATTDDAYRATVVKEAIYEAHQTGAEVTIDF